MVNGNDRVAKAKGLLDAGGAYAQGCSEFVSKVLGIPWESANALLGAAPSMVGSNNHYAGLVPGDVVGWPDVGAHGHVAIFVGEPAMMFIDVRNPGAEPRSLQGYGAQSVVKSSKY